MPDSDGFGITHRRYWNGPPVLKWKPQRDVYGKVTFPARIWLYPEADGNTMLAEADANVPVQGDWLANVKKRDVIELTDARGSVRTLQVTDKIGRGGLGGILSNRVSQARYNTQLVAVVGVRTCAPCRIYRYGRRITVNA